MSDSFIQVPPDSTGKKLDTEQLTVGVNTVERERMQIAGDSATDVAPVTAADGLLVNLGVNNDVVVSGTVTVTEPVSVDDNGGSLTVDGTVTVQDGGGAITVDGTVAVTNAGLTELAAAIDTELQVDVVAALPAGDNNIGNVDVVTSALPTGAATSALQLPDGHNVTVDNAAGAAAVNIQDGGNSITVDGSVTVTATNLDVRDIDAATDDIAVHGDVGILDQLDLTNANPATVAIVDSNGDQITSFGGGTQYTEGDVDASITGTAMLMEGAGDTLVAAQGTAANGLEVDVTRVQGTVAVTQSGTWDEVGIHDSGNSITVDGAVTVSATNLDIRDIDAATDDITVHGDVGILDQLDLTNSNPAAVAIVDGDGTQITSFGGGTQYTEGDTDATITGTAMMWEDAGDTLEPVSAASPLPVNVVAGGAGDGSILDGVSSSIKATVLDLTNSNPLAVSVRDSNGDLASLGGGTQYTEDAAAAADPIGNAMIMVRDDALSGQTTADGDNVAARGTDKGELYVKHVDSIPVTDGGGALTVDGTVAISGTVAVTQSGTWDEVGINDSGNSITVDNAALSVVGGGAEATALRVTIANDSTGVVSVDDNGGTLTVDGTVTANLSATDNAVLDQIELNTDSLLVVGGGTEATAQRVTIANDSTGVLSVDDNGSTLSIDDGAGSLTVDGTVTVTATDLDIRNLAPATDQVEVVGDVAADAAAAGNPVQVGVVQETMADTAPSTRMSADADIGYAAASDGAQYVIPTGPQTWAYHENSSSALTDTSVHAAPGAGLSLYVTDIIVSTGAATAFNVFFEEGASTVLGPYYLEAVAGRGFQVHFQTPKKITANTALTVTTSAAIAHGIDVTGFIARG